MSHPNYKQRVLTEEDLSLIAGGVRALFDLPGVRPWNRDKLWAAVLDALIDARTKAEREAVQQALGAIQALDAVGQIFVRRDE
ncbi:hypothetical protein BE21_09555 [Sorangium cellulosum]|uniref:Uncharacterized protein n=1 Tax=Sorangium cellulosum TaxID=56 RepID=A0A150U247_SORCE|nr:hypothetical protein BE21_09555 [Sorangium cellulosum]